MKIKLSLLLFAFILFGHCYAQYDSLVKPGKKWYYKKYDGERWNPGGISEITNDEVIYNNKSYYRLKSHSCYYDPDTLLIREENKRVYIIGFGKTVFHAQEKILYDFNLLKGDSFTFSTPFERYPPGQFKDSVFQKTYYVDTTFYKDNRKHISLNAKDIRIDPFTWIEGIGSNGSWVIYFYNRLSLEPSERTCALIQVCDNKSRIHPDPTGQCNDTILSVKNDKRSLRIFPNPAQNSFSLKLSSTEKHHITIFNSNGQMMDEKELQGKHEYEIEFNYPKGVYFINTTSSNSTNYRSVLIVD